MDDHICIRNIKDLFALATPIASNSNEQESYIDFIPIQLKLKPSWAHCSHPWLVYVMRAANNGTWHLLEVLQTVGALFIIDRQEPGLSVLTVDERHHKTK